MCTNAASYNVFAPINAKNLISLSHLERWARARARFKLEKGLWEALDVRQGAGGPWLAVEHIISDKISI